MIARLARRHACQTIEMQTRFTLGTGGACRKSNTNQTKNDTMKRILGTSAVLLLSITPSWAATYYYDGSGAISTTTNWWTNRDGTGSNPGNFTAAGNTFAIQSGQAPVLGTSWTISGSGSGLLIETGGSMNSGANNPTLTLSMQSGASYVMANTTYSSLTLGTINSGSNFRLDNQSNPRLSGLTYGGLSFNGSQNVSLSAAISTTTLNVSGSGQLRFTNSSNLTHSVSGSVNIAASAPAVLTQGTGNMTLNIGGGLSNLGTISKAGAGAASLNFNGTGSSTATWGTHSGTFGVTIASSKTLTFLDDLSTSGGNVTVAGALATAAGESVSISVGTGAFSISGSLAIGGAGTTGALAANKITLDGAMTLDILTATDFDELNVSGALTFGGDLILDLDAEVTGDFVVLTYGSTGGTFEGVSLAGAYGSIELEDLGDGVWSFTDSVNTYTFSEAEGMLSIAAVPEPHEYAIAMAGLLFVVVVMRKRRRA